MGPDQPVGPVPGASAPTAHGSRRPSPGPPLISLARNDLLLVGCGSAIMLIDFAGNVRQAGMDVSPVAIPLLALVPVPLLARHRHPVPALAAVMALLVCYSLLTDLPQSYPLALVVALYHIALVHSRRTAALCAAAVLLQETLRGVGAPTIPQELLLLADTVTVVLAVVAGLLTRRYRAQVAVNRQLLAERAVSEERRRIARELHDVVAHHITTMYLMSGGARSVLTRDPDASTEALLTLEGSARTALRQMRQLLGVLRGDDGPDDGTEADGVPGADGIDRLVAESAASGLPVDLQVSGVRPPLPSTLGPTLHRIVQEALTNTRKHAGAGARATVRIDYRPDLVLVEITDDGTTADRGTSGPVGDPAGLISGGYGLLGMRERVAVHGGSLTAGRRAEGGFRVAARLPLPPPGEDPAPGGPVGPLPESVPPRGRDPVPRGAGESRRGEPRGDGTGLRQQRHGKRRQRQQRGGEMASMTPTGTPADRTPADRAHEDAASPRGTRTGPVTVLIADDQPLVRQGIGLIVRAAPEFRVVGEVDDGEQAVAAAHRLRPDVVLMDIRMPVLDGVAATERLTAELPGCRVLALSTFDMDEHVVRALRAGASGFLPKDVSPEELTAALRTVSAGDAVVAPRLLTRLIGTFVAPQRTTEEVRLDGLTPRETEVLRLIATGLDNTGIAEELGIGVQTVKNHITSVFAKLGLRDRAQAVISAYESGLVSPRTDARS
ncbi:two component transcriptional regulator [Streptomyces clavuligerus]|nr:two component transcriptional regulator [Streptomyces clavuligerus]